MWLTAVCPFHTHTHTPSLPPPPMQAGVSAQQMEDPETAEFIYNFMAEQEKKELSNPAPQQAPPQAPPQKPPPQAVSWASLQHCDQAAGTDCARAHGCLRRLAGGRSALSAQAAFHVLRAGPCFRVAAHRLPD